MLIVEACEPESDMGVAEMERAASIETGKPSQVVRKVVVFRVADQTYGISLDAVLEILPMAALTRPPGLPSVLCGFLNLGGTAVPVVNLAGLFDLAASAPGMYTPLLLLRCAGQTLALLADSVQGIASIDRSATLPLQENVCFNDCAEGLVTAGETNIVLLSCQRLLHEEERRRIGELTAIEQTRLAGFQEDPS
jgi:purine-binding chemotaxis protein CheW